jgi:hypothetical protein
MMAMNDDRTDSLLGRRELVGRVLAATVGAGIGPRLLGGGSSAAAAAKTIYLRRYGARGDGRTDDTVAIQRAVNAAPSGFTILGDRGRMYVVGGTVSFPRDSVTLDLAGATIQIGPRPARAASADAVLMIAGRTGVRITNGRIEPRGSRGLDPPSGGRIILDRSTSCVVDHMQADCGGAPFVNVFLGGWHRIHHNRVVHGSIGGLSCSYVLVKRNVLDHSPNNALGFAGYKTAPANGNHYVDNLIRGFGRIGIEDYSPDGAALNYGAVIRGNTIQAPARNATSGTAISAIGTAAVIEANWIRDAAGYAIEATGLGTQVLKNRISWRRPDHSSGSPAIIINSSTPGAPAALVGANHIVNALVAIAVYAGPYLGPLTVERNVIKDPALVGIALSSDGQFSGPTCLENEVSFSRPAPAGIRTRIGIQTTTATRLIRNRVSYGRRTGSRRTLDVPLDFVGNDVVARGNVVDGGGRRRGQLISQSLTDTWSGWTLINNQFVHGASADLLSLSRPLVMGNIGPITV